MRLRHVKRVVSRGRLFLYYVAPSRKCHALPALPFDHPDFIAAWLALDREHRPAEPAPAPRAGPRSVSAMFEHYRSSRAWLSLAPGTRESRAAVMRAIEREKEGAGGRVAIRALTPRILAADIAKRTPAAGRNRLRVWRSALDWAKGAGWIEENPAAAVTPPRVKYARRRAWEAEDVARFRARWPHGTPQRMALELLYWTGARRGDIVQLGRQHLARRGGRLWLCWNQAKTGDRVEIPVSAELEAALAHAPAGALTFVPERGGRPRSPKGFGAWWRRACEAAGVSARAHGLRHTMGGDLAEAGESALRISSVLGHANSGQSEHYTKQAERRRMAESAMQAVEARRKLESAPIRSGKRVDLKGEK